MAVVVVSGASCMCSFGTVPCTLNVTSQMKCTGTRKPVATIMDCSNTNLASFGVCSAPTNPAVQAAMGAPQPCTYVPAKPWSSTQMKARAGGQPVLTNDSTCMCAYMGNISITSPGQGQINVK